MADIKWIKIVTDIFDDEKILLIEAMPDSYAIIVCWFKLLCFAGKQNNNGVLMLNDRIAYTDQMLATVFRMNLNTVRLALSTFENLGMIVIADDVIQIKNWQKYQSIKDKQTYNEYMKELMRKRRSEQKLLVSNDVSNSVNNVSSQEERNKNKEERIKKEEEKNNSKGEFRIYSDNEKLQDAIKAFAEFRKASKKPMTQHAVDLMVNKLAKMAQTDDDKIAILEQSIVNGWTGIYEVKKDEQRRADTDRGVTSPSHRTANGGNYV